MPPHSHKSPSLGVTPWEFIDESYLSRDLYQWAIRWWRNHDASCFRFDTIPAVTDRQTARQTDTMRRLLPANAMRRAGKKLFRQLLTDSNGLEINEVRHLLVVSNATMFTFINTHTVSTQELPNKLCLLNIPIIFVKSYRAETWSKLTKFSDKTQLTKGTNLQRVYTV